MLEMEYASADLIPEGYADLYTEKDGKFVLSGVKGLTTAQSSVARLENSLRKERDEHKTTKDKLAETEQKIEATTVERDELQVKLDSAGGETDQSKIDELVERRLKLTTAPLERKLQTAESQAADFENKYNEAINRERQTTVRGKVQEAVVAAGITDPKAQAAATQLLVPHVDLGEDGTTVVAREGSPFTPGLGLPDVVTTEFQAQHPFFWPATEGGGSRTPGGGPNGGPNPYTREHWSVTEQCKLSEKDQQRLAKIAGVDLNAPAPPPARRP